MGQQKPLECSRALNKRGTFARWPRSFLAASCAAQKSRIDTPRASRCGFQARTPTKVSSATIKHVLQMSSGARWDESYGAADSDIRKAGRALAAGGARTEVAATLPREFDPGTYHRYSSIDTHVLSLVLRRATQMTPSGPYSEAEHLAFFEAIGRRYD
jgi:hypothetical protein